MPSARQKPSPPAASTAAEAIDLSPLEGLVGFNIHILDLQIYQLFYERFAGTGMTPGVISTLLAIRMNPGVRHGALADALMIQRPNMTKLINGLERDGYVRRNPSHEDKRQVVLNLTRKGEATVGRMLEGMLEHERGSVAPLNATEQKTLLSLLRKLSEGLRRRQAMAR